MTENEKDLIICKKVLPAREAEYAEFPQELCTEIQEYLKVQGIPRLYCHQAEMFTRAQAGENLVITTSTASGKTWSFLFR